MIIRKVKLAFVGGIDLIYIHIPYPLSVTGLHFHSDQNPQPHTLTHGQNFVFGSATVPQKTLVTIDICFRNTKVSSESFHHVHQDICCLYIFTPAVDVNHAES